MDADALVAAAAETAGLDDFGAPGWREGLERYLDALASEAQLNDLGRVAIEVQIVGALTNRLRVIDWWTGHPELAAEHVDRPIIVLGLPRTGTTLLSELLHRDPANRSLMRWEATRSRAAAARRGDAHRSADRGGARRAAGGMDALNPGLQGDPLRGARRADGVRRRARPGLQEPALVGDHPRAVVRRVARSTATRPRRTSTTTTCCALLQSRAPGRWALKTPHHCLALDALVAQYPDARLVDDAPRPGHGGGVGCAAWLARCRARSATPTTATYIDEDWTRDRRDPRRAGDELARRARRRPVRRRRLRRPRPRPGRHGRAASTSASVRSSRPTPRRAMRRYVARASPRRARPPLVPARGARARCGRARRALLHLSAALRGRARGAPHPLIGQRLEGSGEGLGRR